MNSTLYKILNITLAIECLFILADGIAFWQIGDQWFTRPSVLSYLISLGAIGFFNNIILLNYYHHKNYRTVFLIGIINTLLGFGHFIVEYNMLAFEKLEHLFFPSFLIYLSSGVALSLSIIYSKAGERVWLKRFGVFSIPIFLLLITTHVWLYFFPDSETIRQIAMWTSISGFLFNIFLIMNFLDELKELNELTFAKNP